MPVSNMNCFKYKIQLLRQTICFIVVNSFPFIFVIFHTNFTKGSGCSSVDRLEVQGLNTVNGKLFKQHLLSVHCIENTQIENNRPGNLDYTQTVTTGTCHFNSNTQFLNVVLLEHSIVFTFLCRFRLKNKLFQFLNLDFLQESFITSTTDLKKQSTEGVHGIQTLGRQIQCLMAAP